MRQAVLVAATVLSTGVAAHPHSESECREGGDFIRNAAVARDAGTLRQFVVDRLAEDLIAIRAFPSELRWFVQDEDDERFLRAEVEAVFDAPEDSERHRNRFIERCLRRARSGSPNA